MSGRAPLMGLAIAALSFGGGPATADELPPRLPIPAGVALEGQGDAAPLVLHPADEADAGMLAEQICTAIAAAYGSEAVARPAADAHPDDYSRRTVILLGDILTNPEILWLYALGYTFVDAAYPAGDGYVIHQVFDPLGAGRNALVIGASSKEGLQRAVARFVAELEGLEGPLWDASLIVESPLDIVNDPPAPLDDEAFGMLRGEALERMGGGRMWAEVYAAIHAAQHYFLSGHEAYLQYYHARVLAHQDFTRTGQDQFYGGLEFWLPAYIQAWAGVEHSDYWSDEDRSRFIHFLVELTELLESRYERFTHWDDAPRIRWNHETFPAMSYFLLSDYLRKYHPGAEPVQRWSEMGRRVLEDQTKFARGADESFLYLAYSPAHAIRYSLCVRDHDIFSSGRAAETGRLLQMTTDNTGRSLGAGAQEYRDLAHSCLLPIATVRGDGSFLGVNARTLRAAQHPTEPMEDYGQVMMRFGQFRPALAPGVPADEPDLQVFALDAGLYRLTNTERIAAYEPPDEVHVPLERAFDKLVFRRGYDSDGQYLLLDGFGRGRHLRLDTNSIARFTDNDRIFLVDTDNDRYVAEKYHNMLTVIRDGRGSGHVPPYAELQAAVDLERTAFSRSRVPAYGDVDWTRTIIWLKEELFIVLDQVVANADGEYILRCHWNGLGEAAVDDDTLTLEQGGQSCAITHSGHLTWSLTDDDESARWLWDDYPYAESVIRRGRQTRSLDLRAGQSTTLGNVIHTYVTGEFRPLTAEGVGEAALVIEREGTRSVAFADSDGLPGPLVTDAMMGLLREDRIALVGATRLAVGERVVLQSDHPVDVELDSEVGAVIFGAGSDATVDLAQLDGTLVLNGERAAVQWTAPQWLRAALRASLEEAVVASAQRAREEARTETTAAAEFVEAVLERTPTCSLFAPEDAAELAGAVVIGDADGLEAFRLEEDGELTSLWRVETPSPAVALTWADGGAPEDALIVCGSADGTVTAVGVDGSVRWSRRMSAPTGAARRVSSLAAGDVTGDGTDEIAVGSWSWNLYLLDRDGEELWMQPAYAHRIASLAMADLNGDGRSEVLVGTNYYTLSAFDAAGDVLLGYTAGPLFGRIVPLHVAGTGEVVIVTGNDGDVLALDVEVAELEPRTYIKGGSLPRPVRERFRFSTGDDVHDIVLADPGEGGSPAIIAGSESGFTYRFAPSGELLQVRAMGAAVRSVVAGRGDTGTLVVAGLETGEVMLLNEELQPLTVARLSAECRWMAAPRAEGILCVTSQSVARVYLPQ